MHSLTLDDELRHRLPPGADHHPTAVVEAALAIGRVQRPGLPVKAYLGELTHLAERVRQRLPRYASLGDLLFSLNQVLFEEVGLRGDTRDHADPHHHYLDRVLDGRCGVPLSLSLIYLSVARQLGLRVQGVAFPGRFLLRLAPDAGEPLLLDPHAGGVSLQREDLQALLRYSVGQSYPAPLLAAVCEAVDDRHILVCLLRNLKWLYSHNGDLEMALWASDRILAIDPTQSREWRAQAELYERIDYPHAAAAAYHHYLQQRPSDPEVEQVRERLGSLPSQSPRVH